MNSTCEQYLEFMDKVQAVIIGQNLTTGPERVAFMRTVLKGDAYTYFNQYFTMVSNEDDVTFILGFLSALCVCRNAICGVICVSRVI